MKLASTVTTIINTD